MVVVVVLMATVFVAVALLIIGDFLLAAVVSFAPHAVGDERFPPQGGLVLGETAPGGRIIFFAVIATDYDVTATATPGSALQSFVRG